MARILLYLFLALEIVLGVLLSQYSLLVWSPVVVLILGFLCYLAIEMRPYKTPRPNSDLWLIVSPFVGACVFGGYVASTLAEQDWQMLLGAILGSVWFLCCSIWVKMCHEDIITSREERRRKKKIAVG